MGGKSMDSVLKFVRQDYWVWRKRPWLKWVVLFLIVMIMASAGGAYYYIFKYTGDLVDDHGQPLDFEKLERFDFKKDSIVRANNGEIVGRFFEQVRDPIKITEMPLRVKQAFIAAEDKRFYKHPGVDIYAILRAAIGNGLRKAGIKYWPDSGASSIPQQLARLAFADEVNGFKVRERSFGRKFKEAKVAIQIVVRFSRGKVLEDFLNMIYFGQGVNGIAEASRRYFNKNIAEEGLSLRETAILAALNKSPVLYSPIFHKPKEPTDKTDRAAVQEYEGKLAQEMARIVRARERYNWVLDRMRQEKYISYDEYKETIFKKDEPPTLDLLNIQPLRNATFGYGSRLVKEMLLNSGHDDQKIAYYGGLKIDTTFDTTIQKIASAEFEKHLRLINQEKPANDQIEGAYIIIEVATGKILALSGGHNFNETQFNRVLASRSPGSAFKIFTYSLAIENYIRDFFDKICNCSFSMRGGAPGKRWSPKNFKEDNPVPSGNIYLATGLIRSNNLATLNLARTMNIESIVELANRMGVWGNPGTVRDSDGKIWFKKPGVQLHGGLVPLLPTAIGASDVNLIELANAYAVLFREGKYLPPTLISQIKDSNGDTLYTDVRTTPKRVLSMTTASKVLAMMRAVTKVGTAKISMRGIVQQVAIKTGTSNGPNDLMMIGGTPEIVMAIRVGHDAPHTIELPEYMKKTSGDSKMQVSAGWVVGPLYRKIIDEIYKTRPKVEFDSQIEEYLQELLDRLSSNGT